MTLFDWIEFGRLDRVGNSKRLVRGWLYAARGHVPIIDRVNFPNDRRLFPGAGDNWECHAAIDNRPGRN